MENEMPDNAVIEFMLDWMYVHHIQSGGVLHVSYVDSVAYWHPDCISQWEEILWNKDN
jgi:hypothetical protein